MSGLFLLSKMSAALEAEGLHSGTQTLALIFNYDILPEDLSQGGC